MKISPDPISSHNRRQVIKASRQPKPNPSLVRSRIGWQSSDAQSSKLTDFSHSPWVGFTRRAREFSYGLATNRCVFWGLLGLAGSVFMAALTEVYQVLWRSTASLGIALIVIGCVRGWIDAQSGEEGLAARCKRSAKKH